MDYLTQTPNIQWFPGHMAKTRRIMTENMGLVDIVVELTDARIPYSSRNPWLGSIIGDKPRIILLNKCDAADAKMTEQWVDYYRKQGIKAIPTDCKSGKGLNAFLPAVKETLKELLARRADKGMEGQAIRMMIVGIPNCGKSSLINRLAGSKRAKVEDRPGVTRNKQWVRIDGGIDLLDMPGVLWPKFDDPMVGEHLAFTGAVKDDVVDIQWLGIRLLALLYQDYPHYIRQRYKLKDTEGLDLPPLELLELVGKKRGMLISGGEVDVERAAIMVLDEFRSATLGRITLESPHIVEEKAAAAEAAEAQEKEKAAERAALRAAKIAEKAAAQEEQQMPGGGQEND